MAAVAMSGDGGVSGFASTLLRQYWSRCRAEPTAVMRPQVVHGVLELVASAYTSLPDAQASLPSAAAHRARAVAYIESHLLERSLVPGRIAAALQMTARNLHYVFSHERETVCQYIQRRRVEESVRALTASAQLRTTTGIALDYGFCSASQYGLAFRRVFGLTPGEYRRRHWSNAPPSPRPRMPAKD
ncbi:MAG: helix-turn-helix domain-containing protein [Steroidobacteraceae bacterium]